MQLVKLNSIFDVEYGNQLDFNKMINDENGINFISRSSSNLGIVSKVKRIDTEPYNAGLITVTLGGSYLLSSFIQPEPFYTAQNIKVLKPKSKMSFFQKLYYCVCLQENRFRYSSHGREANRTLDEILVPSLADIPTWFNDTSSLSGKLFSDISFINKSPYKKKNDLVKLTQLFTPVNGISSSQVRRYKKRTKEDFIPYIRPSKTQSSSIDAFVNKLEVPEKFVFNTETLYVSTDGQGSHTYAYVSTFEFVPNSNVTVLIPKRSMSLQEKIYYAIVISSNRFKFSYGRKPKGNRLTEIIVPMYPPKYVFKEKILSSVINEFDINKIF